MHTLKLLVLQSILYQNSVVNAQSSSSSAPACATTITPKNAAPSVAAGWRADVVANGLKNPRGMVFDREGALLVVEKETGIVRVRFNKEGGGCVRQEGGTEVVVADLTVSFTV
jgi:glucose/arabinose dehydrogenase